MAVGELPPVFHGRTDGWIPTDESDALTMLDEAGSYCSGRCPIFDECAEDKCLVYRLEQQASDFVRGSAAAVGVLDQPTIGIV